MPAFSSKYMRDLNKRLETISSFVKNVLVILSGVYSLVLWIKKLFCLIIELLQRYFWKHRLAKDDVLFYEKNY